jgi:hypothetical protein
LYEIPSAAFKDCRSLSTAFFSSEVTALRQQSFDNCNAYNEQHGFNLYYIKSLEKIGDFMPFYAYNVQHEYDEIGPSAFMHLAVRENSIDS